MTVAFDHQGSKIGILTAVTLAVFTDMFLYDMVVPFLPSYAKSLGASATDVGILFGAYALAQLIATPIVGVVSDRYGRRSILLLGTLLLAAATLLNVFASSLAILLVARVVQGLASAASWTVGLALLADVFPSSKRGWAMGIAMSGLSMGTLLGPPLGGMLFDWGGYPAPFWVGACVVLVDGLVLMVLVVEPKRREAASVLDTARMLGGRRMLTTAGAVALGSLVLSLLEPTLPIHFQDRLQAGPTLIGLLFTAATVAYGVCSPLVGWLCDRWGRRQLMLLGLYATAAAAPFVALPSSVGWQFAVMIPLGVACALLLTPTLPEMADEVDKQGGGAYASVYSLFNVAYASGMVLGPILGGAMTDAFGLFTTLIFLSATLVCFAFVFWTVNKLPTLDSHRLLSCKSTAHS